MRLLAHITCNTLSPETLAHTKQVLERELTRNHVEVEIIEVVDNNHPATDKGV